jgi:Ca-activated chloride channel family protein
MRLLVIQVVLFCLVMPVASLAYSVTGTTEGQSSFKTLSPYFLIEGKEEGLELFPLKSTSVKANINGVIADVRVTQEYANMGTSPINARYVFPASTHAAVHGMRMTVGEDVVVAKIKERQIAKKEFKEAKKAGKSASLLEQHRPNVFSMSVANIMPGERVKVELHYSELLVPEAGKYEFVYPTVVGPRYSTIPEAGAADHHQWLKNPYLTSDKKPTSDLSINVTLTAGLPIQKVACSSHITDVDWNGKSQARITLAKSETSGGNRDFILEYRLAGDQIHSGLMLYQSEKENFFMLMAQPPKQVTLDSIPPREYIFVVDVSGSMHGFPLDTAKVLMQKLISSLRSTDRFNVILFAASAQILAPHSLPATQDNISRALNLINSQRGGGGTELYRALKKGLALTRLEGFARSIVVVTDGYIAAEREVFGLIADNLNKSNVFTFGIGKGVNRYLIEGMAKAGQGVPFVVTDPQAADSLAMQFKAYIQAPVLSGIDIDFGTFEVYDVEPKVQGDLLAQRPLVVCGKWRGQPKGVIRIKGTAGNGPYNQTIDVAQSKPSQTNSVLAYLWARRRLSRLIDFSPQTHDENLRKQVTQLGLAYQMLTRYTSFIAVHEKIRNTSAPAKDVAQPLPLPQHVSNYAVGGRKVPEPGIISVIVLMILLISAFLWRRRYYETVWHNLIKK